MTNLNRPLLAEQPRMPATHALLWSQSQCALHIEPIADMLSENRQAYATDRRMDYVPIYLGTEDECRQGATAVRSTMRQRQEGRAESADFPPIEEVSV